MSATKEISLTTPREVDEKLAELHGNLAKAEQTLASRTATALRMAGAKYYYRGRNRVTDMSIEEAREILKADLDARNLSAGKTHGEALAEVDKAGMAVLTVMVEIREIDSLYTGWSRFFVVTSSNGHIHSSTHCSTCRVTTTYGWLPQLSGKDMAEAIEHFGPAAEALCSVCFPDAPVAKMDANLTQKQTDQLLKGETPEAKVVKTHCSGSGKQAVNRRPGRRYGHCPDCGYHGAVTQYGEMRKHKESK
jgi:hypothetical protein